MEPIPITGHQQLHPYACRGLSIDPDPPEVGQPSLISLLLVNSDPLPLTVSHVEFSVARFGIGVLEPEHLPPLGPFVMPADPDHTELVRVTWTPGESGHRCVQALIHIAGCSQPQRLRRNVLVLEEVDSSRREWQIPFRLGNPDTEPAALVLSTVGDAARSVAALMMVKGRYVPLGQPIQMAPREEVDAMLVLLAPRAATGEIALGLEATSGGRLIDGIQLEVRRSGTWQGLGLDSTRDVARLVSV